MTERPSPDRAVRLLRAKAAELENKALHLLGVPEQTDDPGYATSFGLIAADLALIAGLLADHMERSPGPWGPEDEDFSDWTPGT
jgi:hypothetical protein